MIPPLSLLFSRSVGLLRVSVFELFAGLGSITCSTFCRTYFSRKGIERIPNTMKQIPTKKVNKIFQHAQSFGGAILLPPLPPPLPLNSLHTVSSSLSGHRNVLSRRLISIFVIFLYCLSSLKRCEKGADSEIRKMETGKGNSGWEFPGMRERLRLRKRRLNRRNGFSRKMSLTR